MKYLKLFIVFLLLSPTILAKAKNVDYSSTNGKDGCPKGSFLDITNICVWNDYSSKEGLEWSDKVLVAIIRYDCPNRVRNYPSEEFAYFLLQIERETGIPPEMRGILAAFACKESGYSFKALGDRRFSKTGKFPKARGMYQLWGWARKHIRNLYLKDSSPIKVGWWKRVPLWDYRYDPVYTTIFIANSIARQVPKVKKTCGNLSLTRLWTVAEARIARGGPKNRCRDTTSHVKLMRKWHKLAEQYEDF